MDKFSIVIKKNGRTNIRHYISIEKADKLWHSALKGGAEEIWVGDISDADHPITLCQHPMIRDL